MAVEYGELMGPDVEARNSKGEVIFAMKRKDKYPPTYYLFEMHKDRMDDEEKTKFDHGFSVIKQLAGRIGFPLYDMREITDALTAKAKAVMGSGKGKAAQKKADESGEDVFVEDVSFKIFDHATGEINSLTVGVSARSAKRVKAMMEDAGLDNGPKATEETI